MVGSSAISPENPVKVIAAIKSWTKIFLKRVIGKFPIE
ncbi:hypothetical protein LEP1GSC163_3824 [Leptospira santarosai str. CBC379]|nr:hypothetical protein LEP1GSC163_3824 [Leptospira santarosai str. CBC379]